MADLLKQVGSEERSHVRQASSKTPRECEKGQSGLQRFLHHSSHFPKPLLLFPDGSYGGKWSGGDMVIQ